MARAWTDLIKEPGRIRVVKSPPDTFPTTDYEWAELLAAFVNELLLRRPRIELWDDAGVSILALAQLVLKAHQDYKSRSH